MIEKEAECPKCKNTDFWWHWSDIEHNIDQEIFLPATCECGCSFSITYTLAFKEITNIEYDE